MFLPRTDQMQLDQYQKNQRLLAANSTARPPGNAAAPSVPAEVLPGRPLPAPRVAPSGPMAEVAGEPVRQASFQHVAPRPPAAIPAQLSADPPPVPNPQSIPPQPPAENAGPAPSGSSPQLAGHATSTGPGSPPAPRRPVGLRLTDQPNLLPARPETSPRPSVPAPAEHALRR